MAVCDMCDAPRSVKWRCLQRRAVDFHSMIPIPYAQVPESSLINPSQAHASASSPVPTRTNEEQSLYPLQRNATPTPKNQSRTPNPQQAQAPQRASLQDVVTEEKKRRAVNHLNNNQLLNLIPLPPLHPVPRRVRQRAAHSPHDGHRGLEGICSKVLGPHLLQRE